MMQRKFLVVAVLAVTASATAAPAQTSANHVTAMSRHGNGSVSGAVRDGRHGDLEVQLPSGSWTSCRRSCSETLRVQSIDLSEDRYYGAGTVQNECGIFGCLDIGF